MSNTTFFILVGIIVLFILAFFVYLVLSFMSAGSHVCNSTSDKWHPAMCSKCGKRAKFCSKCLTSTCCGAPLVVYE